MSWTPERWQRLEPHLDTLLDLPAEERASYLNQLPEEDKNLRNDLEKLLAAAGDDSISSMATRAPHLLGAMASEGPLLDPFLNRTLGPYRLLEQIGSGGMGVVYRAERIDKAYYQEVAVKVLRWTATPEMARRFQRERETLALLDHPNVTRILDGGVSEDGVSFLVMELLHGETITQHCQNNTLKIRDRVRLFLNVCTAVHAAHQRLIVHRDLKPSNVVVGEDGTVKVLDFGIAKWLNEDDTLGALLTQTGDRYLTPQYASPEQFRGEAVTTASDVYALGLLLYELLAGSTPYELEGKIPTEQERLICEATPPAPSSLGAAYGGREIPGDLEQVVLKAIRKEPERRYASAEAMADDLRAWLDGRPVSAAPDSRTYRLQRFVSRNRLGVLAATAVMVALVAGIVGMAWQAGVASRERDRARVEARHAQEVVDFLLQAIEKTSPFESAEEVTVNQLLASSIERVDIELADQPQVRMAILSTIGQAYAHSGKLSESVLLFDRAAALADSMFGQESIEFVENIYRKARTVYTMGNADSAQVLLSRAELLLPKRSDRKSRLLRASIWEDQGVIHGQSARTDSALLLYRRALDVREELHQGPSADLARSYHYIAGSLSQLNDPATPGWFSRAADMWRKTAGDPSANLSRTLNGWALWHHQHAQWDSAGALYQQALVMAEKIHGPNSTAVTVTRVNLASFYMESEQYVEAREALEMSLEILTRESGDVLNTAAAHANLGHVEMFLENYAESERAYLEARRIFAKVFGDDHLYVGLMDAYMGRLYWKWGNGPEARKRFASGLGQLAAGPPSAARREAPALVWYGRFLMDQGEDRLAEAALRRGYAIALEEFSDDQWARAEAAAALGICLARAGNRDEGVPLLEEGSRALARIRGREHPMAVWAATERVKWQESF